jgi:hypothetical protein
MSQIGFAMRQVVATLPKLFVIGEMNACFPTQLLMAMRSTGAGGSLSTAANRQLTRSVEQTA